MEAAAPVIKHVVESLMTPVKKELGYWWNSRKNVDAMNEEMTRLNDAAKEIDRQMEQYRVMDILLPPHVTTWLKDFKKIKNEAERIPTDGIGRGCFNIRKSHKAGKQSFDILEKMKSRLGNIPPVKTTGPRILARVETNYKNGASTSAATVDDGNRNSFKSREMIFEEALECLKPKNSNTQMIALCGMGGVGKSHMMEQLKKHVEDTNMFKWVVKVVVGRNTNLNALQHSLAEKTGGALTETDSDARAQRLKNRFAEMSNGGEKKILVILDDLWEEVDLQDIGLTTPLRYGFKLLITSRKTNVCNKMGTDTDAIFNIGALNDDEAKTLFFDTAGLSKDSDPNLDTIGQEIIKWCGNLPIALKVIASTLRGKTNKEVACKVALFRLRRHELKGHYEIVHNAFEISYNDLKTHDEKALFLLSGLFPDDFDIPVEELIRYGWGLKLFSKVFTFEEARLQVETCVEDLISANLLAKSDRVGRVKMHDLARAFALSNSMEVKQASIVNDHDILQQRTQAKSYQRILLKCSGMFEFPKDFGYQNLAFFKVMDGDELFKFPEDFYRRMEGLEVLSYKEMLYPPLPSRSSRCSITLRTLCLHGCKLVSDCSSIGDLASLEVLSFAGSGIRNLPSEIRELKKLKLLDLIGCSADLCIDDGVLQSLVSLEELYIKVNGHKTIKLTDVNCNELEVLSVKLSALEFEFFENKAQPRNTSFKNLERFKISIGCLLEDDKDIYSSKNTLKLVTSRSELLGCILWSILWMLQFLLVNPVFPN